MQSSAVKTAREMERVRYITRNYEDLQGLVWLPFGALLVVAGLFVAAGVTPEVGTRLAGDLVALGGGALILALIFSVLLIRRYYRRNYGAVAEFDSAFLRRYKTYFLVSLPLLVVVLALESALVGMPGFPLPGFLFAVMAGEAASWWTDGRFRRHHFIGAAALTALAGAGFVYELASGAALGDGCLDIALVSAGLYVVAGGLLDHRLLAGTMRDLPEEDSPEWRVD